MPVEAPDRTASEEERIAVETLKDVAQDLGSPSADRVAAATLLLRYEGRLP